MQTIAPARRDNAGAPPRGAPSGATIARPPVNLAIVTDAWHPQVNGVVTTMETVVECLRAQGHRVEVIEPSMFHTIPCPAYPEIRLAVDTWHVGRRLRALAPERIHIVTEGPLGRAAMRFVRRRGWRHTTAFHTRFPEYIRARLPFIPLSWGYAYLRRFHASSAAVLVPTPQMAGELAERGFRRPVVWSRGVDTTLFHPDAATPTNDPPPIMLYVGRIAREKNLEAFLALDVPGTKWIVGDGPERADLERRYPDAVFTGCLRGRALAARYAAADVFVFPSRTDTFGVVMLEAMACGTPIAAYPVTGPIDVVHAGVTGCLDESLGRAIESARKLDRHACRAQALEHGWPEAARFFLDQTVTCRRSGSSRTIAG